MIHRTCPLLKVRTGKTRIKNGESNDRKGHGKCHPSLKIQNPIFLFLYFVDVLVYPTPATICVAVHAARTSSVNDPCPVH